MSDGWKRYRQRAAALQDVMDRVTRSEDGSLPWAELPGLAAVFGEPGELLIELHRRWQIALGGRIDAVPGSGDSRADDVAQAWREAAAAFPSLRRVLDRHAEHPAIRERIEQEHRLLAIAAGVATVHTPAEVAAARGIEFSAA